MSRSVSTRACLEEEEEEEGGGDEETLMGEGDEEGSGNLGMATDGVQQFTRSSVTSYGLW